MKEIKGLAGWSELVWSWSTKHLLVDVDKGIRHSKKKKKNSVINHSPSCFPNLYDLFILWNTKGGVLKNVPVPFPCNYSKLFWTEAFKIQKKNTKHHRSITKVHYSRLHISLKP